MLYYHSLLKRASRTCLSSNIIMNIFSKMFKLLRKVASSRTLLKIIILFQVLLGRYFKLSRSNLKCLFTKLYCFSFSFITSIFMYSDFEFSSNSVLHLEYCCSVITSLIFSDKYFHNFYNSIRTIDRIIGFKNIPLFNKYLYALIFVSVTLRLFLTVSICFIIKPVFHTFVPLTIMWTCLDFSHIFIDIIFSMLHSRMRLLRYFVENNSIPINFVGKNEVAISRKHIRKSLHYYDHLLDSMEFVDKQMQYQIFAMFVGGFPKLISLTKSAVILFFNHQIPVLTMLVAPEIVHTLCDLSCPAIIVEAIMYEVDKIRKTLTKQLVRCSDESLRYELETALQYVSLRPFRYTIGRAVSLNIYLPFSLISLCITYVIVALQLSHFTI